MAVPSAPTSPHPASHTHHPWVIAVAGMVCLAVAMGIGRFAFTPILPMMLNDGVVDLPGASWLASANYLGYMVGAALCTLQPWLWARCRWLPAVAYSSLIRTGLVTIGLLTLAMAWHAPALWPLLRFAAGVVSAVVFVYTSGWCLAQLARMGSPALAGFIYAGPGAGIVVSGLMASALVAAHWRATSAWLIFGVMAFALIACVWRLVRGDADRLTPLAARTPSTVDTPGVPAPHARAEMAVLTVAYALAGFGYIVTATFLPVIARSALPGSPWLDLFWPIFGAGVFCGAALATRLPAGRNLRALLAGAYLMQALGICASLWSPSLAGFAIGSLMLGIPFTAITFFAMQEARRLRPATAASFMGLLTAAYGIGQVAGPPLVAVMLRRSATAGQGFTLSLEIAATALVIGAAMYGWMARAYPRPAARQTTASA